MSLISREEYLKLVEEAEEAPSELAALLETGYYILFNDFTTHKVTDPKEYFLASSLRGRGGLGTRIGHVEIGPYIISTVFLSMDHGWSSGEPVLFETMIFKDSIGVESYCERYGTYQEALAGHEKVVTWIEHLALGNVSSIVSPSPFEREVSQYFRNIKAP